jgi:hypothetical protein
MRTARFLFSAIITVASCLSASQVPTISAVKAPIEASGLPRNPPIFSQATVIFQGELQYQNGDTPKGSVKTIERTEEQQVAQNPNPFHTKTTLQFDESNHLVKRINEASNGISTTTFVWENGKLQREETNHYKKDAKIPGWTDWNEWSYDKNGHLSEFRSGRDKAANTDLVDFKYDSKGRLLGYELLAREVIEISYVGDQVTQSNFQENQNRKTYEQVQTIDNKGRVTDLKVSDMTGGRLTPWYHVAFKYDDQGRVIEQRTDPFKLGSGDDYSPLPGTLTVEYDDVNQTGDQIFYGPDGKLALHTKFAYDRDGIFTQLRVLDSSGNEVGRGENFVDAQYKISSRPGNVKWEVIYDDHGNWTERRRWFTPADGSPRIMTRLIRQTITYR